MIFCVSKSKSKTGGTVVCVAQSINQNRKGAVPVYLGAPNIHDFAPSTDSFIDLRHFQTVEALGAHLRFGKRALTFTERALYQVQKTCSACVQEQKM
jgi:hypothetical protein